MMLTIILIIMKIIVIVSDQIVREQGQLVRKIWQRGRGTVTPPLRITVDGARLLFLDPLTAIIALAAVALIL
jgi:hypothetical protein